MTIVIRFVLILMGVVLWHVAIVQMAFAADDAETYRIDLGSQFLSDVQTALPERTAVNRTFLSNSYDPNIKLTEDSHLSVTFVDEGAGFRNSIGYFEYANGSFDGLTFGDIDVNGSGSISYSELNAIEGVSADYLFSNFSKVGSGGALSYGDSLVIGGGSLAESGGVLNMTDGKVFSAGTNVGFFLAANAYNGTGVAGFDQPGDPTTYYSLDFLNPEAGSTAMLTSATSESRHVATMFADASRDGVLVGFEDLNRNSGDNDFNDAVFLVQSDPAAAIAGNDFEVATAPVPEMGSALSMTVAGVAFGCSAFRRRKKMQFANCEDS